MGRVMENVSSALETRTIPVIEPTLSSSNAVLRPDYFFFFYGFVGLPPIKERNENGKVNRENITGPAHTS